MPSNERSKGILTSWNDEKGFGFITPHAGGEQVFLHIKSITNRHKNRRPRAGQQISYSLTTDRQGRTCADNSVISTGFIFKTAKLIRQLIPLVSTLSFFAAVALAVYMEKIPPFIFIFYILFSLITFIIYAADKSAARKGNWRTKETSLHILSLAGGWPGALLAQKLFRHKSRKQPFRIIFWITTLLNAAVFLWLLTAQGASTLQTLIEAIVWGLTTTI